MDFSVVLFSLSALCRLGHSSGRQLRERKEGGRGRDEGRREERYLPLSISLSRVVFVDSRETLQGCWEAIAKVNLLTTSSSLVLS